jgi:serine/threonine protein kinase
MATEDDETEPPTAVDGSDEYRSGDRPHRTYELDGDRYRARAAIGRGGMGEVTAAYDHTIGREVAIKRIHAAEPNDRQISRFIREAQIQGRLDHPAIVPVYDLGRDASGMPFFVMKKLAGTTLLRGKHSRLQLLRAFVDVCLAVEFAHVRGVIHRDLKPDNIVLGEFGEVYVLDWGVAKVAGTSEEFDDLHQAGPGTVSGALIGTLAYMSPEQLQNARGVDARTDVFALGKILTQILPRDPDPPPELTAIAELATREDRDLRTATARELGDQVQRYLDGDRDLDLRRKLARQHLERARSAMEDGSDETDRVVAIRAASSAMALDPTLHGATELVGRLMLDPPKVIPPEVVRELAADDERRISAQARAVMWTNVVTLVVLTPCVVIMGSVMWALVFGMFSVIGVVSGLVWMRRPNLYVWWLIAFNAVAVAVLARMFSPALVAPAIAGLIASSLATHPQLEKRSGMLVLAGSLIAATSLPMLAESLGLLPPTMEVTSNGLLIEGIARTGAWFLYATVPVYATSLVLGGVALSRVPYVQQRTARRQLYLQAWQLRQLVTESGDA